MNKLTSITRRFLAFILISALNVIIIYGQKSYTITIQADSFPGKKFELSSFYKGVPKITDTIILDNKGKAIWNSPVNVAPGFYRLTLMEELKREFSFIFNKENFTIILPGLNGTALKFVNSQENSLLLKYNNLQSEFSSITDIAFGFPKTDPFYKVIFTEYNARHSRLNSFVNELKTTKPKMFITSLAKFEWRKGFFPTPGVDIDTRKKFLSDNYFVGLDFSDTSIIYMPTLKDMVINYFSLQLGPSDSQQNIRDKYIKATDSLLSHTKPYPLINSFMLDFIIEGMEQIKMEDAITYIYENYVSDGTCDNYNTPVIERAKKRAAQKKLLVAGTVMPDIFVPDSNGVNLSLDSINAEKIILVFWSSACEHCKAAIPELHKWYINYNSSKGYADGNNSLKPVEVFAVSLDTDKVPWKKFITENNLNWINVCDFKQWDSPAAITYSIFNTPTFIILGNDRRLLTAPEGLENLKAIFEN